MLAKYDLALTTLFDLLVVGLRASGIGSTPLVVENCALALLFGAVQSYAWLSR